MDARTFEQEVSSGVRFEFGHNWKAFLTTLNDERIAFAEKCLLEMLKRHDLKGKKLLDIGSGSGLSSLVARRLGASVHSFDYDPTSVACTQELRQRYFPGDPDWQIEQGSVLDATYLMSLGTFDIVYSWGVLHHTGNMWTAIDNAATRVNEGGLFFIALYNRQGIKSERWLRVKRLYCSGIWGRLLVTSVFVPTFFLRALITSVVHKRNVFSNYKTQRGMSIVHDWHDWLGGLPFEVASVEEVFHFLRDRGFELVNLRTTNGLGNNEFIFTRSR